MESLAVPDPPHVEPTEASTGQLMSQESAETHSALLCTASKRRIAWCAYGALPSGRLITRIPPATPYSETQHGEEMLMHTERPSSNRISLWCTSIALLFTQFALASSAWSAPQIEPPNDTVAGRSIGEWTGDWWRAAISAIDFPFPTDVSQAGALGNVKGPVFFAVASPGPGATIYTYTVPRGKHVLFPLYTVVSIKVSAPYSSVCADGSESCDIPSPGPPEVSATTLILNVPCDDEGRCKAER
jgi:hypothetical protein